MRRFIHTVAILTLLGLGIGAYVCEKALTPRVKAPTTHYHGYDLNREAISRTKSFTVLISREGFGGVGRGTGVLIDATHILTCAHMTEGPKDDLWIFPYPTGVVAKGKTVFMDRGDDLAILELDRSIPLTHYATFQDAHYDGEPITIVGNILGSMKWFVSFGIVSGEFAGYILTDGLIHGGNSGGPWINEKGEVVALTDWGLESNGVEAGISGGVSAKTIHAFLKRWKSPSMGDILQMLIGG
jgi:S1-C subfamily serine protease